MPHNMKFLVIIGTLAPIIGVISILTGNIIPDKNFDGIYGIASSLREFIFAVVLIIPLSVISILMLLRNSKAKYLYILGWILLCVSPYTMDAYRDSSETMYVELGFNILIGIVIMFYLLLNSNVKNYFNNVSN